MNKLKTEEQQAPVFVVDSSAIIQLREGMKRQQQQGENAPDKDVNYWNILDGLSSNGRRLILTHPVLQELLRCDTKDAPLCRGLVTLPDGQLTLGATPKDMPHSGGRKLMKYLQSRRQDMRYYHSVEAMIDAGEMNAARGGIILVDDAHFPDNAPLQPADQPLYPPPPKDAGERSIISMMNQAMHHKPPCPSFAIIGNDEALRQEVNSAHSSIHQHSAPRIYRLEQAVSGMCDEQLLPKSQQDAMLGRLARSKSRIQSVADLSMQDKVKIAEFRDYLTAGRAQGFAR